MPEPRYLATPQGRQIAYRQRDGQGPVVVFLHGLRSDMEGTKALFLEEWAAARGQAFLRFDCSGHGRSSGRFEEGTVGEWAEDAAAVLEALVEGPAVLVGSSMGAWLALLLAREHPGRVAGLATIAAAPDFTEDGIWAALGPAQRAELLEQGRLAVASAYGEPLVVTRALIEDGRKRLVLRSPLDLPFPTRCLHGTADTDVDAGVSLRLLEHATGADIRLTLVKGADHRLSSPEMLALIARMVEDLLNEVRQ